MTALDVAGVAAAAGSASVAAGGEQPASASAAAESIRALRMVVPWLAAGRHGPHGRAARGASGNVTWRARPRNRARKVAAPFLSSSSGKRRSRSDRGPQRSAGG